MTVKIAVTGPSAHRNVILSFLTRYAESICAQAELTSVEWLDELAAEPWDLAFIYAAERDYVDYLSFLADNPDCEVVLWALDNHLARPALRSHPRDFIIYPFDDELLLGVMKKCRSWTSALRIISLPGADAGRRIRCIEVQYVESFGHSCAIHCRDEVFTVNRSLAAVQEQLGTGFLRCHRGFVVNLRCVAQVGEKTLLLQDGAEIPLSPAQAESVAAEVCGYIREFSHLIRGGVAL